jgi:hypothetical protein
MRTTGKTKLISLILVLLIMTNGSLANGRLKGSQTITWEHYGTWLIGYTGVLDYRMADDWFITFVWDKHSSLGTDLDMSTTYYIPYKKVLYATVGVRRGIINSYTPTTPYLSITLQF